MNPKVSILVPVYGVEKFIERCARSLFEQTFQDIEYVFVNDCTPDRSVNILKDILKIYPNRESQVHIVNHEVNKGLAGARNTGVDNATGDYILHVDSDDYLELNAIELLYNKAVEEDADIVICNYFLEWDKVNKVVTQEFDKDKDKFINLILSGVVSPCVWNKLCRRSLYTENSIKTKEGVNLGEDLVTTPRLIYFSNKITKVNEPLYHYIQTNSNSYTTNLSEKSIDNVTFVLEELTRFFESKSTYNFFSIFLLRGKLRKKLEFIQQSNQETFKKVFDLFPETDGIGDVSFLTKPERILFYFVKLKNMTLIKSYLKIYNKLFNVIQKFKRR